MDDSVVLIVYALMIIAIIGVFYAANKLYQKKLAEKDVARQERSDRLTDNASGDPDDGAISRYEQFRGS